MRQRVELRQRQKQEVNARFLTAIRLLQMPAPKLVVEIQAALDSNPMLEEVDSNLVESLGDAYSYDSQSSLSNASETDSNDFLDYAAQSRQSITLQEHLKAQLYTSGLVQAEHFIANAVIESIDESGYLYESIDDIASFLSKVQPVSRVSIERVISVIQGMNPPGVAARNLQECLLLQLPPESESVSNIAREILLSYMEELAEMELDQIKLGLGCGQSEVQSAVELIQSLNPLPGNQFGAAAEFVIPDLLVHKVGRQWIVESNEEVLPKLRVSKTFQAMLHTERDPQSVKFLKQNLDRANAFLYGLSQRHQTILRVGQEIVRRQKSYLELGAEYMRPLTLREVADTLNLHESTVSRACSGKYIMTPDGTIELKSLFSYRIRNRFGSDGSTTSIKHKLMKIVEQEDRQHPLSDRQITDRLRSGGVEISRRTVAKYRSELRIPTQRKRKALAIPNLEKVR